MSVGAFRHSMGLPGSTAEPAVIGMVAVLPDDAPHLVRPRLPLSIMNDQWEQSLQPHVVQRRQRIAGVRAPLDVRTPKAVPAGRRLLDDRNGPPKPSS